MIDALLETHREAVMLSEIDGVPLKRIAEGQRISLSGAKSRVQRGPAEAGRDAPRLLCARIFPRWCSHRLFAKAGGDPPLLQFLVQSFAAVVDWSSSRALTEAQPDLTTRWRKRHQDPARGHNARLIAFLSFR